MAGNSSRRGAIKKSGKGNPTAGSGGRVRRGLEGKGPTPKAKDREGHIAYKRRQQAEKQAQKRGRSGGKPAKTDAEWVAGRNSVVEALRAQMPVMTVYVAEGAERDGRLREVFRVAAERGISLLEVSRGELDRLTGGAVHQGLALKIRPYDYAHPADLLDRARQRGEPPLIVALDSVTDPRNLGAIIRSVAAFGGHGVLVPARRSAPVSAGAWKASAGALARVPVARAPNLAQALASYQEAGLFVAGLDGQGPARLDELGLAEGPLVLVVGSEGHGLSRLIAQRCDVLVRIPIAAQAESLNAGVAAGIALYAVAGRRAG
jgi:23S rRNA (guanosine2251-2'-O)-methyltransferase